MTLNNTYSTNKYLNSKQLKLFDFGIQRQENNKIKCYCKTRRHQLLRTIYCLIKRLII